MSNIHLSEEQLQLYTLGQLTDQAVVAHIGGCASCRKQIAAYEVLYGHIQSAEAPLLDMQTEQLIVEAGMSVVRDRKEMRFLYSLLSGIVLLLIGGLIGYWHTIRQLLSGVTTIGLALGVVLLLAVSAMHVLELYKSYQQKMQALGH